MGRNGTTGVRLQDRSRRDSTRDTRSSFKRFRQDFASTPAGALFIGGFVVGAALILPVVSHLIPLILLAYYPLTSYRNKDIRPPIMLPESANRIDEYNHIAGKNSPGKMANGTVFLGNDTERGNAEVWISTDIALRHLSGYGTTGSGKSEYVLAIYMSVLCESASIIELDGKSAADMGRKFQYLVRRFGREDDLFYANYMTAGVGANSLYKISNRTNPLSTSNPQGAYQFLSQFLPSDSGANKIFAERAATVAELTTNILYDRQDNDPGYTVSFGDYDKAMQMPELLACLKQPWLSDKTRKSVVSYLQGLNIDSPEDADIKKLAGKQQTALDQHLYASMYFTRALNSITGTYGYIFGTRYGDFNWFDIINRHRIIKVMLPSMEKSDQERDYLVALNVAMLKQTASKFLDFKLTGPTEYTRSLPHDKSLSLIMFDESNYLLTEGIGIMAGQLRSMKFSMGVWGQSVSAMRTRNAKEMEEIEGNTGCKFYGALEDTGATDDAIKRADKVKVDVSTHLEGSRSTGYYQAEGGAQEYRDVLTASDIKGQLLSEWTMLYKDKTIRLESFYAPELAKEPSETRINDFCHGFDDRELPSWLKHKLQPAIESPSFAKAEDVEGAEAPYSFNDHMRDIRGAEDGIVSLDKLMKDVLSDELAKQRSEAKINEIKGQGEGHIYSSFGETVAGVDID